MKNNNDQAKSSKSIQGYKEVQIIVDVQFSRLLYILCTSSMIAESWECKILPLWDEVQFIFPFPSID